jgi:hypothetical protein
MSARLHHGIVGFILLVAWGGGSHLSAGMFVAIAAERQATAPFRDLSADERLGGHTLQRHVGKSDQELAERLRREPQITAASSYDDAKMASRVVGTALARSASRLDRWLARRGPRTNLVLNYTQSSGPPIGRSLLRGERTSRPCDRAVVVLRWDDRRNQWYVLTSYPEARR